MSLPKHDDVINASQKGDNESLLSYFPTILKAAMGEDESLHQKAVALLKDLNLSEDNVSGEVFIDSVWIVTSQLKNAATNAHCVSTIKEVTKEYPSLKNALVSSLDAALLEASGVIENQSDLQKRLRQHNTLLYYRQQKFNLLSEESQGYSKLLEFLTRSPETLNVEQDRKMLLCLIGEFSLDPSRCLDLVVRVLELEFQEEKEKTSTSRCQRLMTLIHHLPKENLPKLLSFALSSDSNLALLRCMARLVAEGILPVSDMLKYLPAWRELAGKLYEQVIKQEKEKIKASTRIRLSSSASSDKDNFTAVDVSELGDSIAMKWVEILLLDQCPGIMQTFPPEEWSQLCVLLPRTIGSAICGWVQAQLTPWVSRLDQPPWVIERKDCEMDTASDELPSFSDLEDVLRPLKYTLESGCLALCPGLFTCVCRILALYSAVDFDESLDVLTTLVLPTMGCWEIASSALSGEVWKTVEKLPYRTRFDLYAKWRGSGLEKAALNSSKPLWQVASEIQAGKDARYQLKRLSKDTIRDASRGIAKVCHGHPLVVFSTILNQIESYDNLVEVMVDALRFVTPLGLDVLGYCILARLNGTGGGMINRSRLKPDGVNVSQWLQSLESFTGYFYKRYPSMELGGILEYLVERLKAGHVMELGMMRTLLKTAGGWAFSDYSPAASLSHAQLEGRSGSTSLMRETMSFGVIQKYNPVASVAIRSVLQKDDVGVSLLILLAQVRNQILFEDSDPAMGKSKPVKLIGNLLDSCQVIVSVLLNFLVSDPLDGGNEGEALKKFAGSLPSLEDLISAFNMDLSTIWMLCRPLLREIHLEGDSSTSLSAFKITDHVRDLYMAKVPEDTWKDFNTSLFETFYTYSLYDFSCPTEKYTGEVARLEKEMERLKGQKGPNSSAGVKPGNAPNTTPDEEIHRCEQTIASLKSDQARQKSHVGDIHEFVGMQKASLFPSNVLTQDAAKSFLTHCVFPRCMQSPDDALYCAHFVDFLHTSETAGFGTLHFYDAAIISMSRSLFAVTEGEAANISIFLVELWKNASRWRYDKEAFESEVDGKPGSSLTEENAVTYSDFETLYNKWHAAIGGVAIGCLQSKEYIHIRNCLILLTRLVDVYPTRPMLANGILTTLEPLQDDSNPLADIRAAAQAYSMQLVKARDDGVWKEEDVATVKARQAKEKAAEESRKVKAQEAMKEIQRDAENITKSIGDAWDRPGNRARGPGNGDRQRSRSAERIQRSRGRDGRREEGRGELGPRREEPPRRDDGRGGRRDRDDDRRSPPRSLEGRFQPREPERTGTKRSREPSPEPGEETNKRARTADGRGPSRRRNRR